jgi:hypothetical protein
MGGGVNDLLQGLAKFLPTFGGWARRAWCNSQRRQLIGATTRVVWVSPDKVAWAAWGAERRFFDVESAGGLVYLRGR